MRYEWLNLAACRGADINLFFTTKSGRGAYKQALGYCAVCPVVSQCLDFAIRKDAVHGVFGGQTPSGRQAMIKAGMFEGNVAAVHGDKAGTPAGYYREKSLGLTPCPECREAANAVRREQRRRLREQRACAISVGVGG